MTNKGGLHNDRDHEMTKSDDQDQVHDYAHDHH